MNEDVRELYRRAEREMRPELLARLVAMLVDEPSAPRRASTEASVPELCVEDDRPSGWRRASVRSAGVPSPEVRSAGVRSAGVRSPERRRGRHGWGARTAWVAVAAATIALLVAATLPTGRSGRPSAPADLSPVPASPPACAAAAETVGVALTRAEGIRVGLMPDGATFCVSDDETGDSIPGGSLLAAAPVGAPPAAARVVEQGVLGDRAYYAVVEVPAALPVVEVRAPGHTVASFPSRVGRRFLVIDPDYDPAASPAHPAHVLSLRSAAGMVLATVRAPELEAPSTSARTTAETSPSEEG